MSDKSFSLEPAYVDNLNGNEQYEPELVRAQAVAGRKITAAKEENDDTEPEGQLTIDVYQTPHEIVVESAVAAVAPEDLEINVTNDAVTIRGSRRREKEVRDEDYLYQECYWGRFSRQIILPQEVDADSAVASLKNGILTIRLPKAKREKTKKLKVRVE